MIDNKDHNELPDFIHDYFSDPNRKEIESQVLEWLKDKENNKRFSELYGIWQSTCLANPEKRYDVEEAWHDIKNKIPLHQRKKAPGFSAETITNIRKFFVAASVILFISALGLWGIIQYKIRHRPLQYTEYTVPYSSMSKVILPDSSTVWINAGSTIKYNSDFGFKNRDVLLTGEAFFNVAKDPNLPFDVKLRKISFRAIGTKFNIKAYSEDPYIEAIVEEGKIQLHGITQKNHKNSVPVYLAAKQKLVIPRAGILTDAGTGQNPTQNQPVNQNSSVTQKAEINYTIYSDINTEIPISWKEENWIIDRERFEDFAVLLQRRYNVKIIFADESLKDFTFSGVIKNETLEQMLKAIYLTTPIEYEIEGNIITLRKNKRFKGNN